MINTDATSDETSGSIEHSPAGDASEMVSPPSRPEAAETAPSADPDTPRRPRARRSKSGARKKADPPAVEQTPETDAAEKTGAEEARPDPDAQSLPSRNFLPRL